MTKYIKNPDVSELYRAAYMGDIPVLRRYLELGGNSNIPEYNANLSDKTGNSNGYEYTLPGVACMGGQKEAVKILLESNANPNMRNFIKNEDGTYRGLTPLQLTAQNGFPVSAEIAKELLRYGADINYTTPMEKMSYPAGAVTPLQMAAQSRSHDCMEVLLNAGAAVSEQDRDCNQALHYAVQSGSVACVGLLLDRGANINAMNVVGNTPSHIAAQSNNREVLAYLAQRGADLSIANYAGKTPRAVLPRQQFEFNNQENTSSNNAFARRQMNTMEQQRSL